MAKKTTIQRMREVRRLLEQLEGIGLGPHTESYQGLEEITKTYVKYGKGASGVLPLPAETSRVLIYELSEKQDIPCTILLKKLD